MSTDGRSGPSCSAQGGLREGRSSPIVVDLLQQREDRSDHLLPFAWLELAVAAEPRLIAAVAVSPAVRDVPDFVVCEAGYQCVPEGGTAPNIEAESRELAARAAAVAAAADELNECMGPNSDVHDDDGRCNWAMQLAAETLSVRAKQLTTDVTQFAQGVSSSSAQTA